MKGASTFNFFPFLLFGNVVAIVWCCCIYFIQDLLHIFFNIMWHFQICNVRSFAVVVFGLSYFYTFFMWVIVIVFFCYKYIWLLLLSAAVATCFSFSLSFRFLSFFFGVGVFFFSFFKLVSFYGSAEYSFCLFLNTSVDHYQRQPRDKCVQSLYWIITLVNLVDSFLLPFEVFFFSFQLMRFLRF